MMSRNEPWWVITEHFWLFQPRKQIKSWPQGTDQALHSWMGSYRTCTGAPSPFGILETSPQSTALLPAHDGKPEDKRASCAHLKPFAIKVKYSSSLAYGFFSSVNIKVAGSETWLAGLRVLISPGVSMKKIPINVRSLLGPLYQQQK